MLSLLKKIPLIILTAFSGTAFAAQTTTQIWSGSHTFNSWGSDIMYQAFSGVDFRTSDRLIFHISGSGQIQIAASTEDSGSKSTWECVPQDQGQGDYDNLSGSSWTYTIGSQMASMLKAGNYLVIDGHDFTLTQIDRITDDGNTDPDQPVDPGDITWKQGTHLFSETDMPWSGSHSMSGWSNKLVFHPSVFPEFDTENYTYTIKVKASGSIQSGYAQWDNTGSEISSSFTGGATHDGDFEIAFTPTVVKRITENGYCLQFNGESGTITRVELVVTEGGYVVPDYSKGGFHTDGLRLLDANDNEFVMRGINYSWGWNQDKYWQIKSSKDWGFNTIRIQVGCGRQSWCQKPSADDLRGLIEECEKNKLVAVFNVQDVTNESGIDDLMQAVSFWCQEDIVQLVNEHRSTVIVNINNEWPAITDQERWRDGYVQAVPMLREAGIVNTLMIDCGGWGQDYDCIPKYGAEVLATDPLQNIMYSMHMYQTSGRQDKVVENISKVMSANCPVVFGEIAFEHKASNSSYPDGGPVAWKEILEFSYRHNLGWIGWSWSGNGGGAETCDMFGGSDWQPLENGKCLIYGKWGSKMTSTQCTVYDSNPGKNRPYRYPDPSTYANESFSPFPYPGPVFGSDDVRVSQYGHTYVTPLATDRNDAPAGSQISKTLPFDFEYWHNSQIHLDPSMFTSLGDDATLRVTLSGISDASQIGFYVPTPGNPEHWDKVSEHFSGLANGTFSLNLRPSSARRRVQSAEAPATDDFINALTEGGLYIKGTKLTVGAVALNHGDLTGVTDIDADSDASAPEEIYTLTGVRVTEMAPGGIYIVRQGNKVRKVIR